MANFIAMVYATLKADGVDTKGMSTDQAVAEFNKRHGSDGSGKKTENTPAEKEKVAKEETKEQPKAEKEQPKQKEYERSGKGIKEELKDKGFNTKNISVRERSGGYSTAYYITIKDPTIDKHEVEKIAEQRESYERDYATGEILAGGNTYVFVDYDDNVFDEVAKPYEKKANDYLQKVKNIEDGYSIGIKDGVWLSKDNGSIELVVQNDKQHARRRIDPTPEYLSKKLYQLDKFNME